MTDFSGDTVGSGTAGSSRADADRDWWGEPDPVEIFAAGLEPALRQLRVEVAGLRAERDGLRLEVEGLRAKLAISHEQLAARDTLRDTVRQLQTAVGRLTVGQTELPVSAPAVVSDPVVPSRPVPTPALDELRSMGLWPPRPDAETAAASEPATATAAPPAGDTLEPRAIPVLPAEAAPDEEAVSPYVRERTPPTPDRVVNWDRLSTRRTPVVVDAGRDRFDGPAAAPKRRRGLRTLATALVSAIGALVIIVVLLVSVGPRLLPYQTYFVRSGSMEPTISTGAMVVLTKTDGSRLEPGDIITFENPDNESVLVTHRIVDVETTDQGRVFVTKGDANANPDAWRVPASGTGWKYAFDVPVIGYVFGYLGTSQARLALLVIPAAILGLLALVDIWRPKEKPGR